MVDADRITEAVRAALREAASGKGAHPHFLTTYQLLDRFPETLRKELVDAYGEYGQGAGKHYTAASRVAAVLRGLKDEVDVEYLDARGLAFDQESDDEGEVRSGYPVIGIYRLKR